MANQTVTTNMTIEEVIAGGLNSGDNITINNNAVVTCTETPSVLIGSVTINYGELHIDGQHISANNVINFVGEGGLINGTNDQTITVNGQGKLNITGDWFDIGTTDGTNDQIIDLSTATGVGYWGRRIDYNMATGTTPSVGDWIYKSTDRTVMGKIHSVGTGYLVVWLLQGSLSDGDDIQCRKVVNDNGPDMQISWTANVSNPSGDIKEDGVYMEFGNARCGGTNYISSFGNGLGGLVYIHEFQSTELTLGSNTGSGFGGFVPPIGCNIRIPNVIVNTSSLVGESGSGTPYADGLSFGCAHNTNESEWYAIECSAGGVIDMSICNWGNSYTCDSQANKYDCEYVGTFIQIGSNIAGSRTSYNHCVVSQSPEIVARCNQYYFGNVQDNVSGTDVSFCMYIGAKGERLSIGGATSIGVDVDNCIYTNPRAGTAYATGGGYTFNIINGGSFINNCFFGNNHIDQSYAFTVSTSPDITIEDCQISMTQDYTEQTSERSAIRGTNSSNLMIKGVNFIGNGTPGDYVFYFSDQTGVKVRAVGMIDDKIDLGVDGEYVVYISGLCDKIDVARLWFTKSSTITEEFCVVPTTCKEIIVTNCGSKYAAEVQPSGGANTRFKGLHGGAGTPGGSVGWEDQYVGTYGNSFHDGFQSDTEGSIVCLMISPSTIADETSIIAGNPLFYKDGDLNMVDGDVIEFEMGYYAKGHTGFSGKYTATTQTSNWFADEWSNVTLEFQYQLEGESWNGTWLDVRTPINLTGISGAIEEGIKFKFRFTATGKQNDMSMLLIDTTTTLTAQKENFYPIDQMTVTVKINAKDTSDMSDVGSAMVLIEADAGGDLAVGTEILKGTTNASGFIENTEFQYTNDQPVIGKIRKSTSSPYFKTAPLSGTITENGLELTGFLIPD